MYNREGEENEKDARAKLLDTVQAAGEVGFSNLVRALVRNGQERLARSLDDGLARQFIVEPPPAARECSLMNIVISIKLLHSHPIQFSFNRKLTKINFIIKQE